MWAADPNLYPEIKKYISEDGNVGSIDHTDWVYLEPYMFGVFKDIVEDWGMRYWKNPRITRHEPELILPIHNDHSLARIHIPMTIGNAKFYWGEKWNREYTFEVGNIYMINAHILHSTTNFNPVPRANILADLYESDILEILNLK